MATSETIGSETLYSVTDAVDDNLASYFNGNRNGIEAALRAAASARVAMTPASMTGNVTLTDDDLPLRSYSPTANRDLTFPAAGSSNHAFYVINRSSSYIITLKTSGAVVFGYVTPGGAAFVVPDGTNGFYVAGGANVMAAYTPTLAVSGGTAPTYTENFITNYSAMRKRVRVEFTWSNAAGGTAGAGTNPITATLPITASSSYYAGNSVVGVGTVFESGGTTGIIAIAIASTTTMRFYTAALANVAGQDQSSASRVLTGTFEYDAA